MRERKQVLWEQMGTVTKPLRKHRKTQQKFLTVSSSSSSSSATVAEEPRSFSPFFSFASSPSRRVFNLMTSRVAASLSMRLPAAPRTSSCLCTSLSPTSKRFSGSVSFRTCVLMSTEMLCCTLSRTSSLQRFKTNVDNGRASMHTH